MGGFLEWLSWGFRPWVSHVGRGCTAIWRLGWAGGFASKFTVMTIGSSALAISRSLSSLPCVMLGCPRDVRVGFTQSERPKKERMRNLHCHLWPVSDVTHHHLYCLYPCKAVTNYSPYLRDVGGGELDFTCGREEYQRICENILKPS